MSWKTITVPKAVYLPTLPPDGQFKNSGIRVAPTDKIEIKSGTHNLRVNGSEYQLFVACDTLRLDKNNCLVLDAPAPPVANLSAQGGDRAFVGGIGQATAAARGQWDQNAAAKWRGDEASSIGKSWVEAQIQRADKQGAFEDEEDGDLFDPQSNAPVGHTGDLDEDRVSTIVTLKDGTQAEALLDPTTGRQAGTVSRVYSGIGTDPKEAARLMAEQARDARDVTFRPPPPPPPPPPAPPQPQRKVAAGSGTPSGLGPIFDGFLQTALQLQSPGFHQGATTFLQVEAEVTIPFPPQWVSAPSCETAFARLHKAQGVYVAFPKDKTSEHVLDLAEHLPGLTEVASKSTAAIILIAPWPEGHPLLTRLSTHHIVLGRHATDPRFLTATLLQAHGQTLPNPKTVSWPEKPPAP